MKQVLIRKGRIIVEEVPAPALDADSVLVETAYSLISAGTETSVVAASGKSLLQMALDQPKRIGAALEMMRRDGVTQTLRAIRGVTDAALPTGYSCSGVVLEVGRNVADLKRGTRVACAGTDAATHAEINFVPRNFVAAIDRKSVV